MSKSGYLAEFEQVVLLAVARLTAGAYGMAISDEISRCTGREVSIGSVYSTLDRLERKGYVSSLIGDPTPSRGGRAKRYFQIQPSGIEALRRSQAMVSSLLDGLKLETGGGRP